MLKKIIFIILSVILLCNTTFAFTKYHAGTQYILDTDMGFDDWIALTYFLEQKSIDIAGVTIDCQGETYCPAGAINASKITQLMHRFVPIAMGASRPVSHYDFPVVFRDFASKMSIPDFHYLKSSHNILKISAAEFIKQTIIHAAQTHHQVVVISIGSATNMAAAWQLAEKSHQTALFRAGLKMFVKGGGAFGAMKNGKITNQNIMGNVPIPNVYASHDHDAEWNVYANAPAMQIIMQAKLPITFVPNNATEQVPVTKSIYEKLINHAASHSPTQFIANAILATVKESGGWRAALSGLDFWDTIAVMVTLHPGLIENQYTNVPVTIITKKGHRYGAIWISPNNKNKAVVTVDYHVHANAIYQKLTEK